MNRHLRTLGAVALSVITASGAGLGAQRAQPRQPVYDQNATARGLLGTYELDRGRSGDPERAARTATNALPPGQRDRAYQTLLTRLEAPDTLSIERRGSTVTLSSSRGRGATFEADGRVRTERGPGGQTLSTRAEMIGDQLRVSTTGRARNDNITLTFEPVDNGNGLRVTRRLDDNQLRAPVTLQSYYRRTASTPTWDVYDRRGVDRRGDSTRGAGGYGRNSATLDVPDGTRLIARLDTPLSMRDSRDGEPFTLTVDSPNEWQGARIDGTVARVNSTRQGSTSGDLRLDFRTISLRGRQADFDATLDSVRLPNGTEVSADREGSVRDSNDTATTVRNGAIGAAIGAVIGAVAGGGSRDAAIGAVVGGVGGVVGGMILQQGHEQLDMPRGTDITMTSIGRYSR